MEWSCHRTKGKDKARLGLQRRVREEAAAFRPFRMLAGAMARALLGKMTFRDCMSIGAKYIRS